MIQPQEDRLAMLNTNIATAHNAHLNKELFPANSYHNMSSAAARA